MIYSLFQDLSKQLSGIESMLQIMQNIIQSLAQKSNSVELKLQNIVEDSAKTSKYFSDIDNKFQTLNIKIEKRERQLKKQKKKPAGMEKHAQTEYNLFIKPGNYEKENYFLCVSMIFFFNKSNMIIICNVSTIKRRKKIILSKLKKLHEENFRGIKISYNLRILYIFIKHKHNL